MLDKLIVELDKTLRDLTTTPKSVRAHPDANISKDDLTVEEMKHSIGLMRINHCGEVCAQGLYHGQGLFVRVEKNKEALGHAAWQEEEHLAWTAQRIHELGGNTSVINPLFYFGSLGIGAIASICGDEWSLGFLEETEKQVGAHLQEHLELLPAKDCKSRAILEQMKTDEAQHAEMAHDFGAKELPAIIKHAMQLTSKLMTKTVYYI